MKDYKWNDPSLNNIENNNLFMELKTYLQFRLLRLKLNLALNFKVQLIEIIKEF